MHEFIYAHISPLVVKRHTGQRTALRFSVLQPRPWTPVLLVVVQGSMPRQTQFRQSATKHPTTRMGFVVCGLLSPGCFVSESVNSGSLAMGGAPIGAGGHDPNF